MFARHFVKSPETIAPAEIRSYQLYLSTEKNVAPPTVAIAVSALRFLYSITLQRRWMMEEAIPLPKRPAALPPVLSADEVLEFLECVRHAKHRTILMSCYAAGLRISEVVRLKPGDVDSRRMVIRIEQGKVRRDRYVMLSPRLLETFEKWRGLEKTKQWLFPGNRSENPITRHAVEKACREAHRLSGISKRVTPHSLRRAFAPYAGKRNRYPHNSTAARPQQYFDDRELSSADDDSSVFSQKPARPPAPFYPTPCTSCANKAAGVLRSASVRRIGKISAGVSADQAAAVSRNAVSGN